MASASKISQRLNGMHCLKRSTFSIQKHLHCNKIGEGQAGVIMYKTLLNEISRPYIPSFKAIGSVLLEEKFVFQFFTIFCHMTCEISVKLAQWIQSGNPLKILTDKQTTDK